MTDAQRIASLLAILVCPSLAFAATPWFSVSRKPAFADVLAQLQVVVDEHAEQARNRFCVVGEMVGSSEEAWVYWPDGNRLILWRPDRDNPHAIAGSNRSLDLKRDVVAGNDVGGSTYKLTRAEADETIRACALHGDNYVIEKQSKVAPHG